MAEHLSDRELDLYRNRALPADQTLSANRHLFSCSVCFARFQTDSNSANTFRAQFRNTEELEPESCLEYEEMKAYVDDELIVERRLAVEEHIDRCSICRDEVADLLLVKSSNTSSGHSASPPRDNASRFGGAPFATPLWSAPVIRVCISAAVAGCVLALAWLLLIAPMRREISSLRDQVSDLRGTNELLRRKSDEDLSELKDRLGRLELQNAEVGDVQARQAVVLNDGGRVIRLEGGQLQGLADPYFARIVKRALVSSRAPKPSLKELSSKAEALMGVPSDTATTAQMTPVAAVVEDDRPVFSWSAVPGASRYEVLLTDARNGLLIKSNPIDRPGWRPSEPLHRGRVYSWAVKASFEDGREVYLPSPTAPRAKFKVLDAQQEEQLSRARSLNPPSHLLLAVLSAQAGLTHDAIQQLKTLASSNPGSLVVRKLLASLERDSH